MVLLKTILNIILPPLCFGCKKRTEEGFLCRPCRETIEIKSGFSCPNCKRRLPRPIRCPVCGTTEDLGGRFILASVVSYENPVIRELLQNLKYKSKKTALEPINEMMNVYLQKIIKHLSSALSRSIIIPIPLHPTKEKKRGFNQAELIAEGLRQFLEGRLPKEVDLPRIETGNLVRIKNTDSQTRLKNYEERKNNVAGCFKILQPEKIAGKNIILVDDVFTSGATMKEAVRVLKGAGAKRIIGFVVAKA